VLFASVYDCDAGWPNPSADELRAADAYGFHAYALSNPDGYGTFGNNGISNDEIPLPCSDADSKEIPYARTIIDTIPSTSAIYTSGFSQNAMMAYYYHACFDRVSGTNQGGSGLALHGVDPTPPGGQVECTFSSAEQHGVPACKVEEPCDECMYWPAKPVGPLKTCLQTYTNEYVTPLTHSLPEPRSPSLAPSFLFGTDLNMFQTASVPGNDVRRLVFSPSAGVAGGHGWSQDNYVRLASARAKPARGRSGRRRSCARAKKALRRPRCCLPPFAGLDGKLPGHRPGLLRYVRGRHRELPRVRRPWGRAAVPRGYGLLRRRRRAPLRALQGVALVG
jgi:hypothetical protein